MLDHHHFEVRELRAINIDEAMRMLIDGYSGRDDGIDWEQFTISADSTGASNCIGFSSTFERLMTVSTLSARPHLTKSLCAVFKNLLGTVPGDERSGIGNYFIKAGASFIGVHAQKGETLGHLQEATEVFGLLHTQLARHNPNPEHTYNVKALTDFVTRNLDSIDPKDLQPFLSYGSMFTHLHQKDHHQILLKKVVIYEGSENGAFPSLPLNQALMSVYIGATSRAAWWVEESSHNPEHPFSRHLLLLSDEFYRLGSYGCHIPGCQLTDLQLVSQTITAISKAFLLADDQSERKRYEQGLEALVNLTTKVPGTKLTVIGSVYAETAFTKKELTSSYTNDIVDRLIKEAKNRPFTASAAIESAVLRFNRQVYLEVAFRAPKVLKFEPEGGSRKLQLRNLADLARDGLQTKEDFSPLGKAQKLWIANESGDEKTKMAILETHPELRKDAFIHDLGI